MTKLEMQVYTHPPIPLAEITPLEKLILEHVLECSETDAGLVLFSDVGSNNPISVRRKPLLEAFRASAPQAESALNTFIASRVLALLPALSDAVDRDATVDIDLGAFPWPFIIQDIVSRSPTLSEVTVIQWMNHPSRHLEIYSTVMSLITAKAIHHATSEDILARFRLQDRGLSLPGLLPASSPGPQRLTDIVCSPSGRPRRLSASGKPCCISEACTRTDALFPMASPRCRGCGTKPVGRPCAYASWRSCLSCRMPTLPSSVPLRMAASPSISTSFRQL